VSLRAFAANRAGLKLELVAAEGEHTLVRGNRALLEQALLNLIINAEQALAPGRRGTITVSLDATADSVNVAVADDGGGVSVEPRERAFEPFVTTKDPWQGAGLGLWAARAIAGMHDGSVTIEADGEFVLRLRREVET
jgi:two-component system C4-dicarboxylate transport sensor histidine kinase DctB